jgi:hypothetical protein
MPGGSVKKRLEGSGYKKEYKDGLGAIKNEHRSQFKAKNTHNLEGSMDIDKARQPKEPHAFRWDYLVVVLKNDKENLALIEVHGAVKPGEIEVMNNKKKWLLRWLSDTGLHDFPKSLIWVSTAGIKITPQSIYGKRVVKAGLPFPKRVTPWLDTEIEYKYK